MNSKLISPLALEQQQMSEQIYAGAKSGSLEGWCCSARIPESVALGIYQRNLHGGVAQHLQAHFPVMVAYIGVQAYQFISAQYLNASPPDQPIFTIYAAHFPAFLLEYGEENPQQLIWSVAAQLAQIDFFHLNTFCENQRAVVEARAYQLWISAKSFMEQSESLNNQGLYRQLDLHPERYHEQESELITLVTFWDNEELFFRVE